jgi:Fe2+ transport system protein FeoA
MVSTFGGPSEAVRLVDAPAHSHWTVISVDEHVCGSLAQEGLGVGAVVAIERRLAFGGPLIVRLGRARLAIARSVAAGVQVVPEAATAVQQP